MPSVDESDPEPVQLPGFTVFGTDSEVISIIVRNDVDRSSANVEVYNSTEITDAMPRYARRCSRKADTPSVVMVEGGSLCAALRLTASYLPVVRELPATRDI